ncbi:MAG: hypothetical protein ACREFR_14120 [Limisphaerales bacterium]
MSKSNYLKSNDIAFAAQLNLFKNNIVNYAEELGVTPGQVGAQSADAIYFSYVLQCQEIIQSGAQQWTSWKNLMRAGGNPPPTGAPAMPVFPTAVAPVALGIEVRFRALAKQIKANTNYNDSIGKALGIEGAQQTPPDLSTIQPLLATTISGNQVYVDWGWQGYSPYLDQCELQVDRGDGKGYVLLAYDTTPGYTDTQPFPTPPAKWTYRAIYCVADNQVGQWSLPVSLVVGE